MALKDYEESRGKVSRIQAHLKRTIDDIRTNDSLSDSGRRKEMAKATLAARRQAAGLKAKMLADRQARRESLEKRLFGITTPTPTELMVIRDSRDRAANIANAEEAQLKLQLANQSGDAFLAKSIAQVAATKGWGEVVNAYADTAPPGTRAALEELADIPSGLKTNLADAATFTIHAPKELGPKVNDDLLMAYAEDDEARASRLSAMEPHQSFADTRTKYPG